jgi:two-component system cell cycle response regulator CtrA
MLWRFDMDKIEVGDVVLYPAHKRVEVRGEKVRLVGKQWDFIRALGACPETLVTRECLVAYIYPDPTDRPGFRALDMVAHAVRKKIADASQGANYIRAINSCGYVLCAPA